MEKIEVEILDKHKNYMQYYIPNDLYWGIGIENETYLEFSKKLDIDPKKFYIKNAKRERYSVNYFNSYKTGVYDECINKLTLESSVPILLNANSFSKTDINNQSITTYTKNPEPNPNFNGKILFDFIAEKDSYFKDEYMKSYIFDGDTIEFITQNFYKTNIYKVINELTNNKKEFIYRLKKVFEENNIFQEYGEINFCKTNYPFVSFMTNLNNCSIFNNMTYHFNFTLPTQLNANSYIKDYKLFKEQHKNAIHLIQWVEPFLVAIYGSGDIFSTVNKNITPTSQRIAKSRYIGLGTYDTDTMKAGKILQIDANNNHLSKLDYWWYNKYHTDSDYTKEDLIGVDINFHKHKNHGIELRIFDYFDESKLASALEFCVLMLDHSLAKGNKIDSPVKNKLWNQFICDILKDRNVKISEEVKILYEDIFDLKTNFSTIPEFYEKIHNKLLKKYEYTGECYNKMIRDKGDKNEMICCEII
jgi:hypothetical protein